MHKQFVNIGNTSIATFKRMLGTYLICIMLDNTNHVNDLMLLGSHDFAIRKCLGLVIMLHLAHVYTHNVQPLGLIMHNWKFQIRNSGPAECADGLNKHEQLKSKPLHFHDFHHPTQQTREEQRICTNVPINFSNGEGGCQTKTNV